MPRSAPIPALLDRARAGDRDALGELLEQFRDSLCDLARQLLSPELSQKVAASDLVQETCIDAIRDFRSAGVDHVRGLEAWLVKLLTNNLIDWQRKFKRSKKRDLRRERPLHDHDSKIGLFHATFRNEPSPDDVAMAQESQSLLENALQQLPRGYREIILWRNQDRLTWPQIAKRLNRSEDAVRMLWNRAVQRLKKQLRQQP